MQQKKLIIALIVCAILLVGELIFLGFMHFQGSGDPALAVPTGESIPESTDPSQTQPETLPSEFSQPETEPSQEPEPTQTEPQEQRYMLTFVGDCTLASDQTKAGATGSFIKTIGEDYGYPFRNVLQFFEDDDFTMVNLESVLADEGVSAGKTFAFKGPTAYTQILTGSSVEAVTLANNHTEDYGKSGYASTTSALESAGMPYVEKDGTLLYTTDSGLTIGIYAASFTFNQSAMKSAISNLRSQGAEIVVCAFHWGNEGKYRPNSEQVSVGHAAIDAGADIVYGCHPHVLQKIEEYNGGIIYYSLGNFSFGGNHFPRDMDSVIVRQEVIRNPDGSVELGELTLIPVSISSMSGQNNFQPTPYEEGSKEYERTMSKLDGTFTGADLVVDYSFRNPTESTEGSSSDTGNTGDTNTGTSDGNTSSGGTDSGSTGTPDTPADPGTSGGSAGSDSGSSGGDSSADTPAES